LSCFHVEFQDKECKKCSARGDPRYLYTKCHYQPPPKHPKGLIDYHPGELERYHPLGTHQVHAGKVVQYHEQKELEWFHPIQFTEVEREDKDNPIFTHNGSYLPSESGAMCCKSVTNRWSCCNETDENAQGCKKTFGKMKVKYFACCEKDEKDVKNGGCNQRFRCCHAPPDDAGCVKEYECCKRMPNSEGCRTRHLCCEEDEGHQGCKQRYTCCLMPDGARGCRDKFECCGKGPESKGCITVCNRCDVEWGHRPGCSWPELDKPDDDQDIEIPILDDKGDV